MTDKRGSYNLGGGERSSMDLVSDEPSSRSHRRVFAAIGALLVVAAVVTAGIIITTRSSSGGSDTVEDQWKQAAISGEHDESVFTLDEFLMSIYTPITFSGTWISDTENMDESDQGLFLYNVETQIRTLLVPFQKWVGIRSYEPTLSSSRKYVLGPHDRRHVFRYSKLSRYSIYDIEKGIIIPVSIGGEGERLQYVAWIPKQDALVMVYRNDIYIRPAITSPDVVRITQNGIPDRVYNGVPDWVYEEEVVASDHTLWMNADGSMFAYAMFNDTLVDVMPVTKYGERGLLEYQYPITVPLHYPKPGRQNPSVAMFVVDLHRALRGENSLKRVPVPSEIAKTDYILASADWMTNETLSVTWMSRHQNYTVVSLFDAITSQSSKALDQPSPDSTWNDIEPAPMWSKDGSVFLTLLPKLEDASNGYYKHIHAVASSGLSRIPLTHGLMTVTEIVHWDQANHLIYFMAAPAADASQRHLYTVTDASAPRSRQMTCITCNTSTDDGRPCYKNSVDFSTDGGHYVWTCEGPSTIPRITLHSLPSSTQKLLITDNRQLKRRLRGKLFPRLKLLTVKVAEGLTARVRLMLPPQLRQDSSVKYPMLVYTYGGPNSQVIGGGWGVSWPDHLVTERNIIYAMIDGRGSGYRGDKLRHSIYYKMGTVEVEDQIAVTKKLQDIYGFIDANRTGIWGWSYGGYVTAMAMATDFQQVFKCGMAVAPVTNWIYYDTIYTERYMGLPTSSDNADGYAAGDVTGQVDNFARKQFLLIHGTADDNVHYQQSMMLSRALELSDILFSQQTYPDETHSLGMVRNHHYHTMERFLEKCFLLPQMPFTQPKHHGHIGA